MIMKRVIYGKSDTPMEKREYTIGQGSPVGTREEIREAYRETDIKQGLLTDVYGKNIEQGIVFDINNYDNPKPDYDLNDVLD